jgi:hypothetical protein
MFVADTHPEKMNLGVVRVSRTATRNPRAAADDDDDDDDASARDTDDETIGTYDTGSVPR